MNRLSPLIVRRVGPYAPAFAFGRRYRPRASVPVDDLKLFLTGWAGGLVFFATFLG
ncbi:MAG TPA: hypothetical protein VGE84_03080 [Allosphingosinicella sp.]